MDVILSNNNSNKRNVFITYLNNEGGLDFEEGVLYHTNENNTGDKWIFEPVTEGRPIEIMMNHRFEKRDESMRYYQFFI